MSTSPEALPSAQASSPAAISPDVLAELARELPPSVLRTDPEVVGSYARDEAPFCPVGEAAVLVLARSTQDVAAVMRVAHRERIPVVVQGARTGTSGGANAIDGCILLSLEKMTEILEINQTEQIAIVQPGVINSVLSAAVAEQGLFYPPDPGSWEMSTIGGNVATNAGGMCCVKYGVTTDYVRALEVVLPGGEVIRTGTPTAKGVAGLDITHLVVGSEGTLGVVTEITLELIPAAEEPLAAVGIFGSVEAAAAAVKEIKKAGLRLSMCELLDHDSIVGINAYKNLGLPVDAEAILLIQSDRGSLAHEDLALAEELFTASGAAEVHVADDPIESRMLLEARRLLAPATMTGPLLIEDVCVPLAHLAELVKGVADIGRRHGVRTVCPGHAGDGNLHPTIFFDPADSEQVANAHHAFDDIMALGLSLGGTITGEHGVGILKREWLTRELGPAQSALQWRIKEAFDPHWIMNPGKVFEPRS